MRSVPMIPSSAITRAGRSKAIGARSTFSISNPDSVSRSVHSWTVIGRALTLMDWARSRRMASLVSCGSESG